ncbi:GNAT family N-acetyltransferase [Salininema proteolyticum]|uniref:GNAT family N-acetyltransferase n=1 Tax=Salininema proteolyticum TaxID=1607685 RepID=A0ABV8TZ78_9ACTN
MSITIRPIRSHEYHPLGEVTVAAYESAGYLAEGDGYADYLRDVASRAATGPVLVAVENDRVLGGIALTPPGSAESEIAGPAEAEIRALAVDPEAGGRGVGTRLARAVVDLAFAELGAQGIALSSLDAMRTAHRIYTKLGFDRVPERDWTPVPGIRLIAFALDRPTA